MNINFCQQEAHLQLNYFYICIQEHCNQPTRFACILCSEQQLFHEHCDPNKMIPVPQFMDEINKGYSTIINLEDNKLSDENFIMNLQREQLDFIIQESNNNLNKIKADVQKLDYFSQFELKFPYGDYIYTQQISSDEKYLAFGNSKLTIIDFQSLQNKLQAQQTNKLIKVYCNAGNRILEKGDINQEAKIIKQSSRIIKFSEDNKSLYSLSNSGLLSCFDVKQNFKRFLSKKISKQTVNIINLKIIQNKFIFASSTDKTIKLYYIKYNKLMFNIKIPNITALDYDIFSNNIFCSYDENICVINRFDRKQILNQKMCKKIFELVCLQKNKLLSRHVNSLTLWSVDYQNKYINSIRTFTTSDIIQFSSVCNNQKFIIINWDKDVLILDINFALILKIPDAIRSNLGKQMISIIVYFTQQLDSMNYLILPGGSKYLFLINSQECVLKVKMNQS
ncbi:hypothetical protein pb186bvf_015557 [Paramecium bursaria]